MQSKNQRRSSRRQFRFEQLENRRLLAVNLVEDLNPRSVLSPPTQLTVAGSQAFFTFTDRNGTELWKSDGTLAGSTLVKDINPGTGSSNPTNLVGVGAMVFFSATTPSNGTEIWRSDGTEAGTLRLTDRAGNTFATNLTNVGGTLYFSTFRGNVQGYELWKSNGTPEGTEMVHAFGADSIAPSSFTQVGSLVYFLQHTNATGTELWATDGTSAGTALVRDIRPGSSSSNISQLTASGSRLYFAANNGVSGNEVWRSEGTSASTVILRDLQAGSGGSDPTGLTDLNGTLYFAGTNSAQGGRELYRSSASTANRVKDIFVGASGSNPTGLINVAGTLFFSAFGSGTSGYELWKSDGTDPGTVLVRDIDPAVSSYPTRFNKVGSIVYFITSSPLTGWSQMWKSDGTPAGTVLVKDLQTIGPNASVNLTAASDNRLWFTVDTSDQLWTTDGTEPGTQPATNLVRTSSSSPRQLSAGTDKLAFFASDGQNAGLFFSDGTAPGTNLVVPDIFTQTNFVQMGSFFFYRGYSPENGYELWKTDGTLAGTSLVKDAFLGPNSSYPSDLTVVGNKLFFIADNGTLGRELWVSDGSPTGTFMVKNIRLGVGSSNISNMTNFNGNLYFSADSTGVGNDRELYKSDGTPAGTDKLLDISSGSSSPAEFTEVNGKLYFVASGSGGREIWSTDGTAAGTQPVADIVLGPNSSNPAELTRVGNELFFTADDGTATGREIWKSNGTSAGTVLVANVAPAPYVNSYASRLTGVGNRLYFTAYDFASSDYALWTSDGSAVGTLKLTGLAPNSGDSLDNFTPFADKLVFTANDGIHGVELWSSDGTPGGTKLLKDIWNSGDTSSNPSSLTPVGDQLFFVANDGNLGTELWKFTLPLVAANSLAVITNEGTAATNTGTLKYASTIAASSGTVVDNGNGTWSWSGAAPDGPNLSSVTVTVTDSDGLTASTTFSVETLNVAPLLTVNSPSVAADEGGVASNSGQISDPGIDSVTLSASIGSVIDNGNGTWSWSLLTTDGDALDSVTITATDSDGAISTTTFNVQTLNVPPVVAASASTATIGEGLTAAMNGTISDPGIDSVILSVSAGAILDNGNGTWSWSFATNDGPDQSQVITVTATDSDGAISTTTFALEVQNRPPVIAANNASVTVNEGSTASNSGTFSDPGLDTVNLSASFGTVVNNNDGTWSWTANTTDGPDQTQTVTITATDSDAAISTVTFNLQVDNLAPTVASDSASVSVSEGATADQSGTYADLGVDTVSLTASFGSVTNNGDGTWSWTVSTSDGPDQSQVVTITATDSDGASSSTTFQLDVTNVAPVVAVNSASITANEGAVATNNGTTSDIGLDIILLTASFGTVVNNDDGTWNWSGTPADGPDDTQTVTITATDSDGASSSTSFLLTVQNVAPNVTVDNATIVINQAVNTINTGTYADPGFDLVSLTHSPSDFGTLTNLGNGTWSWSYYNIALLAAPVVVTVTATDSDGAVDTTTFTATPGVCTTQVLTTADSGDGSLRSAISCSNALPGSQTISFAIPGAGPHAISLNAALPAISDTATLDASTQPGFSGAPLVFIDGLAVPGASTDGLRIQAPNVVITGVAIGNFAGDGIEVVSAANVTISGSYLGLNAVGVAAGNRSTGLRLNGSNNATVNGNVISNNAASGVLISGAGVQGNTLTNNLIGTNASGTSAMPNRAGGVVVQSSGNNVGLPGAGNTISGNTGSGLVISVAAATNNNVQGNRIGTRQDGTAALPNTSYGALVRSAGNQIGGDRGLGQGNLFSGNLSHGLVLSGVSGNFVEGNLIGTNLLGDLAIPNGSFGIYLAGASSNFIGSLTPGKGNVISGNSQTGVIVSGATSADNLVQGNLIGTTADGLSDLGNGGNGINLRAGARSNRVVQNVISGNSAAGVSITEPTTRLNRIQGNLIGVDALGTTAVGNGTFGILLKSPNNSIGGSSGSDGNTIAGSTRGIAISDATAVNNVIASNKIGGAAFPPMSTGIFISLGAANNTIGPGNEIAFNVTGIRSSTGGNGNRFTQNSIHDNSTIGIDLGPAGPTANDVGDADSGSNRLQNWPVLTSPVNLTLTDLIVSYSVPSLAANASFPLTIEFFKDNGSGQGSVFLGSDVYSAADQLAGIKSVTLVGAALIAGNGSFLTATATDGSGNSSEFSATAIVGLPPNLAAARAGSRSPYDVSADGQVSPLDALTLITMLNASKSSATKSVSASPSTILKGDVNGDKQVTPLDVLLLIDWLRSSTKPERSISETVPGEAFDWDVPEVRAEGEAAEATHHALVDSFFVDYEDVLNLAKRRSR